jgi:hypothetical protein
MNQARFWKRVCPLSIIETLKVSKHKVGYPSISQTTRLDTNGLEEPRVEPSFAYSPSYYLPSKPLGRPSAANYLGDPQPSNYQTDYGSDYYRSYQPQYQTDYRPNHQSNNQQYPTVEPSSMAIAASLTPEFQQPSMQQLPMQMNISGSQPFDFQKPQTQPPSQTSTQMQMNPFPSSAFPFSKLTHYNPSSSSAPPMPPPGPDPEDKPSRYPFF